MFTDLFLDLPVQELIESIRGGAAIPEVRSAMISALAIGGIERPEVIDFFKEMISTSPLGLPFARVCREIEEAARRTEDPQLSEAASVMFRDAIVARLETELGTDRPVTERSLLSAAAITAALQALDSEGRFRESAAKFVFKEIESALTEPYHDRIKLDAIERIVPFGPVGSYIGKFPHQLVEKGVAAIEKWGSEAAAGGSAFLKKLTLHDLEELVHFPKLARMIAQDEALAVRCDKAVGSIVLYRIEENAKQKQHNSANQFTDGVTLVSVYDMGIRIWGSKTILPTEPKTVERLAEHLESLSAQIHRLGLTSGSGLELARSLLRVTEAVAPNSVRCGGIVQSLCRAVETRICHQGKPVEVHPEDRESIVGLFEIIGTVFRLDPERGKALGEKYLAATKQLGYVDRFRVARLVGSE